MFLTHGKKESLLSEKTFAFACDNSIAQTGVLCRPAKFRDFSRLGKPYERYKNERSLLVLSQFVHELFMMRDLSRSLYFSTCSRLYSRAAGTKYRSVRLWLYLRYGYFDLQSADFFRFFIR